MNKLLIKINANHYGWLFLISIIFFLLRLPSLLEPNWYGDEGIYQAIGYGLRSGREVYTGVWDNKPPLLFVIYALANGDQFTARLFSIIFGIGAIFSFNTLSKKLFSEKKVQLITTLFFSILFGLPMIEGNIANSENFMLFPILVSANLFYSSLFKLDSKIKVRKTLFLAGFVLSLSFLIKIVSIFDFAAFLTFTFFFSYVSKNINFENISKTIFITLKKILWFIIGFLTPVIISIIYFYFVGLLPYYIDAAFGRNVDYVGVSNFFIIPQGLLYLRIIILGLFLLILLIKRNHFEKRTLFILIWFAFSLFNSFFSFRPYTHYLLMLLSSFSLLIGFLIIKREKLMRFKILAFILLVLFLVDWKFHYWSVRKNFAYYQNFYSYITNNKDFKEYQSFFDPKSIKDYAIVEFLKKHTKPKDVVLLWGNSSQIYPMSQTLPPGRYAAAYHVGVNRKNVDELEADIRKTKPKYIIITPDEQHVPFDMSGYQYYLTIEDSHIYERTF